MIVHAMAGLIGGVTAGALYLAGLWFTVQRLPAIDRPLPILLASSLLRLSLLLLIIAWLAMHDGMALGGFLLGFVLIRIGATWLAGTSGRSATEAASR
ncbi:MAG: ATP synthase subunit I [Geminicoccales bacterium]